MMYFFKYTGIFAVALCLSLSGFLKSHLKKEEIKRLKGVLTALSSAGDMLLLGNKNRSQILCECFGGLLENGRYRGALDKSGKARGVINSFLEEFGGGDTAFEVSRIEHTKREISECLSKQEKEYAGLSKIWRTAGLCAGLATGIMLI